MARYKMTVVFDVHDDEDRSEFFGHKFKKPEMRKEGNVISLRAGKPKLPELTDEDEHYMALANNRPIDDFLRDIVDKLKTLGGADAILDDVRVTYEVKCEKLKEE